MSTFEICIIVSLMYEKKNQQCVIGANRITNEHKQIYYISFLAQVRNKFTRNIWNYMKYRSCY